MGQHGLPIASASFLHLLSLTLGRPLVSHPPPASAPALGLAVAGLGPPEGPRARPLRRLDGMTAAGAIGAMARKTRAWLRSNVRLGDHLFDQSYDGMAQPRITNTRECFDQGESVRSGEEVADVVWRLYFRLSRFRKSNGLRRPLEEKRNGHLKDLAKAL